LSALPEHAVKAWISEFGVAVPRGVTVPVDGSVEAAASALTAPLVVKAYGPGLLHKSDSGAVRLHNASADDAAQAAAEMLLELRKNDIEPDGFLIEEQSAPGVEVIIGAVRDAAFGPVLLVGLGGVWTEVLHDTALRLLPITAQDAHDMLDELRGRALLDGFRGQPAIDRDALVRTILAVSDALGTKEFEEFELNPVICGPNGAIAVDARLVEGARRAGSAPSGSETRDHGVGFAPLFAPKSIAVVGASTKKPNFGNMFIGFYKALFKGELYAVHPTAAEIDGVTCVKSLAEADVDYALVAVPAAQCPAVLQQAAGIPYVQVMSGGFREVGNTDLEEELIAAIPAGTRLLGPNCMGVYSPAGGQTFIGGEPGRPGHVSVISQSGGLAGEVIKVGERRGLTFAKVATVGNSADVTPAELLAHLSTDDDTSAIGLYLEDPRDGRSLYEALQARTKPVVALIGGRSAQGRKAAASHTGSMVSDARVWQALGAQTGMSIVTSQDDLIGVLDFFDLHGTRDVPDGDDVLVIGPSGGASVLAADVFDAAGLRLGSFQADEALKALGLGVGTSLANPLEIPVGPIGNPALIAHAVQAILAVRPFADVIAHVNVQSFFTYGTSADPLIAYAESVGDLQRALGNTRITLVTRNAECAPAGVEDAVRAAARRAGVPVYRNMEAAAVAVSSGKLWSRHGSA
jgi:acyl-CoA synthetase (NDP forming)